MATCGGRRGVRTVTERSQDVDEVLWIRFIILIDRMDRKS